MERNKLNEVFIDCVATRIGSLGYRLKQADTPAVKFESMMMYNQTLTATNLNEIPSKLYLVAVNMAALEFLTMKKTSGGLDGFDFDAVLSQISEGDTSMKFNTGASKEEMFDALVKMKREKFQQEAVAFRRLLW